ncbi:hypothetical protein HYU06_01795 [Candidatus Woesearchaeota archaeon]|nr:hypothetical protein [Candidatus Woesearchaeota archaeon]
MNTITITILNDPEAVAKFRADDLEARISERRINSLIPNTGNTPRRMLELLVERRLNLSEIKLLLLDELLPWLSQGFRATSDASFESYIKANWINQLPERCSPKFYIHNVGRADCDIVREELKRGKEAGVITVEGSVVNLKENGYRNHRKLATIMKACKDYSELIARIKPDIAMLGIGPMPYPHSALNCEYTPESASTGLRVLDLASRKKLAYLFGGYQKVPPYGLSIGPRELIHDVKELWITAAGTQYAGSVSHALLTATKSDNYIKSSIGYLITASVAGRDRVISIVLDDKAAEILMEEGNRKQLIANYHRNGINIEIRDLRNAG